MAHLTHENHDFFLYFVSKERPIFSENKTGFHQDHGKFHRTTLMN